MGLQGRAWYRQEQRRKRQLYWNERTGEMEFDQTPSKRRWRWPYRLRPDLPYWIREWLRAGLFFGALGLLYLAWTLLRGWIGPVASQADRFPGSQTSIIPGATPPGLTPNALPSRRG